MNFRKFAVAFGLVVLFVAGVVLATDSFSPTTLSVSPNAVCSVMLDAKNSAPKFQGTIVDVEDVTVGGPDTMLKSYFVQRALLVPNSKNGNSFIWVAFLSKDGCAKAKTDPGYLGAGGSGFGFMSDKVKARVLKVNGQCVDAQKKSFPCIVPFGDSKAVKGATPYFPFQFTGRKDLNF